MPATPTNGPRPFTGDIRVLIADDHAVVREGLRALVEAQPGIRVLGEASDGEEAWRLACHLEPDVLIIDLSMPGTGGAEAAERVARECPKVRVLALTMHEERGYVSRLLRAGAAGYVLKRTASSELVRAIRAVAAGKTYVDSSLAGLLLSQQAQRTTRGQPMEPLDVSSELTGRETEVLRLVALGHTNKEIAASLDIAVKTVETHKANAMAKLGLPTRAAVVRFAMNQGWLTGA